MEEDDTLSIDDVGSEQVRALQEALAPQVAELEHIMDDPLLESQRGTRGSDRGSMNRILSTITKVMDDDEGCEIDAASESSKKSNMEDAHKMVGSVARTCYHSHTSLNSNDYDEDDPYGFHLNLDLDDDDMDHEMEQLAFSEDILRRELDLAKDFATFFGSSPISNPTSSEGAMPLNLSFGTPYSPVDPATLYKSPLPVSKNSSSRPVSPIRTDSSTRDAAVATSKNKNENIPITPPFQEEADLDYDEEGGQEENQNASQVDLMNSEDFHSSMNMSLREMNTGISPNGSQMDFRREKNESDNNITPDNLEILSHEPPVRFTDAISESIKNKFSKEDEITDQSAAETHINGPADYVSNKADSSDEGNEDTNKENTEEPKTPSCTRESQTSSTMTPRKTPNVQSPPETPSTSVALFKSSNKLYTSTEHFTYLKLRKEPQGAWYSVDMTSHLLDSATTSFISEYSKHSATDHQPLHLEGLGIKEYCLSITQWKRLFVGLRLEEDEKQLQQIKQQEQQPRSPSTPQSSTAPTEETSLTELIMKQAPARTVSIRIRPDVLCGAVMDAVTQTLLNDQHSEIIKRQGGHLQATVVRGMIQNVGHESIASIADASSPSSSAFSPSKSRRSLRLSSPSSTQQESSGPLTFFVDVQLCTNKSTQCERVLLIRIYHWNGPTQGNVNKSSTKADMWSPSSSTRSTVNSVSQKNGDDSSSNGQENIVRTQFASLDINNTVMADTVSIQSQSVNLHLREACALIQRIESPELARKIRPLIVKTMNPTSDNDVAATRLIVSEHLLQHYRACPSVLHPDTTITLPALSPQDWPVIQASWAWIHSVWDELETRELTYLSLLGISPISMSSASGGGLTGIPSGDTKDDTNCDVSPMMENPVARFGAFPALPTLDVQYCSQLRRLSRESMIGQLLNAASVLEDYARQAEFQCANLIDLLRPTFAHYAVATPSLPKPAPLSAYPLEYTPPQSVCPPWGLKVMEALNQVAAMSMPTEISSKCHSKCISTSSDNNDEKDTVTKSLQSLNLAETAVQMIYNAFQSQDEEEQSARLARKNLQVMDRLEKMQHHNRTSIHALSTATTSTAVAASDEYILRAKSAIVGLSAFQRKDLRAEANNANACDAEDGSNVTHKTTPWREVPLLKWTLGVGGSSGTCTITANQIIFTPAKFIPILGKSQSTWFALRDIEFSITETQSSLLNPLSATIHVLDRLSGGEAYSFKPSSAALRLQNFLDVLQKESMK